MGVGGLRMGRKASCQVVSCGHVPQLFQIDTAGCMEVVRERKARPPTLLQAGARDSPPLQVRSEGECQARASLVPATLPSRPSGTASTGQMAPVQPGREAFPGPRRPGPARDAPGRRLPVSRGGSGALRGFEASSGGAGPALALRPTWLHSVCSSHLAVPPLGGAWGPLGACCPGHWPRWGGSLVPVAKSLSLSARGGVPEPGHLGRK